jgi:hypothetical protein
MAALEVEEAAEPMKLHRRAFPAMAARGPSRRLRQRAQPGAQDALPIPQPRRLAPKR